MQLFLAVVLVHGGDEHAAGVLAHHLAVGQVEDGNDGLADELIRLIELVDAGEYLARSAGAVIELELQKLLALFTASQERTLHTRISHFENRRW